MVRSPLDILTSLATKDERIVAGIMSGTSVDAIDVALVRVQGGGEGTQVRVLAYTETLFPEEVQQMVFMNAEAASSSVRDLCVLHALLARLYAASIEQLCAEAGRDVRSIDLVGMHGQTIHHLPEPEQIAGWSVRSTLQLGSGPVLASLLGVPVVSDFRAADMAWGGQGAPILPYVDFLLFRSRGSDRVLLNIGGIANITILPAGCLAEDVRAYDTGPGNMVIDALMRRFFGREFDEDGAIARGGRVNGDLLSWMLGQPFFHQRAPKSAGREVFGTEFVQNLLDIAAELAIEDPAEILTTAAECTVRSVIAEIRKWMPDNRTFEVFISGGGARNRFFTDGIRMGLHGAAVRDFSETGVESNAREAVSIAVLANEWLQGNPANLPLVTGAEKRLILGSLAIG